MPHVRPAVGLTCGSFPRPVAEPPLENRSLIDQALRSIEPWIESGELKPVIGAKFPFPAAAESFRLLMERHNFGQIVLTT